MEHSIESALALNGKDRATLSPKEEQIYNYFCQQGRKFNIAISVISKAPQSELKQAKSSQHYDEIIKRYGSEITVKAN
ncbi:MULTISPECIES: hypothetical protein [Vibrio]|uniref:Uncharacterized protein n=1 Tax=Vibrio anguillarum TaxID=55601 RepID=A0AAW4BF69_VIBAN|nr:MULTISPECIES: hypothetical protein [Vibrio]MBF4374140.1 hypothetical protein [Vibrio anguillarum]MBF4436615.1 hypothetical protein [Vibrio anguillarum]MDC5870230.1 hypothetical protein [Vibrio europaeus]NOI06661.1 hypothetical protein [Vibrio anguillarum]